MSQRDLNNDLWLPIIGEWTFQWKMQFGPELIKRANGVYFSRKPIKNDKIPIKLYHRPVQPCES